MTPHSYQTLRRPSHLALVAALSAGALFVAGCGKKNVDAGLPAPAGTDGGVGTGSTSGGLGPNGQVPGSQGDFVASITSDRVLFGLDQFDVDQADMAILQSQAAWLARYPNVSVTIEGHADERGTRDYNLALGERRANAVRNYLASLGVATSRMTTISYGKERPVALGSDEASWAQNRRAVTVTVNR